MAVVTIAYKIVTCCNT